MLAKNNKVLNAALKPLSTDFLNLHPNNAHADSPESKHRLYVHHSRLAPSSNAVALRYTYIQCAVKSAQGAPRRKPRNLPLAFAGSRIRRWFPPAAATFDSLTLNPLAHAEVRLKIRATLLSLFSSQPLHERSLNYCITGRFGCFSGLAFFCITYHEFLQEQDLQRPQSHTDNTHRESP